MTLDQRERFIFIEKILNDLPVFKIFGAAIQISETGISCVGIEKISDIHTGGFQSNAINGMVIMGLLDSAICSAALSHLEGTNCATVEMSVKFIKPIIGNNIRAQGEVISRSKDIYFCQSSIIDLGGQIRALATGVVKTI